MKKILIMLLALALFACNNEDKTDTTVSDTTVIEKDNTIYRDTGINRIDTINRADSVK